MDFETVFSKRKTISISVKGGSVIVRCPYGTSSERVFELLKKHEAWILKHVEKSLLKEAKYNDLSDEKIKELKKEAKIYFNTETKRFSEIMGLKYGRITITSAKTRFGSCSSKKNICFSYRLMLYPPAAREYVIVHELCHLVHLDHSKKFYSLLMKYMPDYKVRKRLLN